MCIQGSYKGMVSIKLFARPYKALCVLISLVLVGAIVVRYGSIDNHDARSVPSWTDIVTGTDTLEKNEDSKDHGKMRDYKDYDSESRNYDDETVAMGADVTDNLLQLHSQKPFQLQFKSKKIVERSNAVWERCKAINGGNQLQPDVTLNHRHFIVNDDYKLLYCFIPKVACTNLKRVFLVLTGQMNTSDPSELPAGAVHSRLQYKYFRLMKTFNDTEKLYRLTHYKKIIFVRDPFERVLSAYRDKLAGGGKKYYREKYGRYIVKTFRKNPSKYSLERGNGVTFPEFVKYLIKKHDTGKGFEKHWQKYTKLCHPCNVKFDFIGRFDNLDQDMDDFLEEIGFRDIITFPEREQTYRQTKTNDVMREFYSQLKKTDLEQLIRVYANDSFLFDLKTPSVIDNLLES